MMVRVANRFVDSITLIACAIVHERERRLQWFCHLHPVVIE
ncbi:MAG TPA: hypothetical protein EYP10_07005 [Armatimonadetes bacterium]|nr:hypothetical protein [Armatimonadota bacterium]